MSTTSYASLAKYAPGTYVPAFDYTGTLPANLITDEKHNITAANGRDFHFIVPLFAPFFVYDDSLVIGHTSASGIYTVLREGIDYLPAYQFIGASRSCAKPIYGAIGFINTKLAGTITLSYHTLGGNWTLDLAEITSILTNALLNPRSLSWEQVVDKPVLFPVIDHEWNLTDLVGASDIVRELHGVADAILASSDTSYTAAESNHMLDTNNPHVVNKAQVGLGNVENFPVANSAQALAGTSSDVYMTPSTTSIYVNQQIAGLDLVNTVKKLFGKHKAYFHSQS